MSDAEAFLRGLCAQFCGTPIEDQSPEIADIALALEAHMADAQRKIESGKSIWRRWRAARTTENMIIAEEGLDIWVEDS